MTLSTENESVLKYILTAQIQNARKLLATLEQEYQHLATSGSKNLSEVLNEKTQQLSVLSKTDHQLLTFLSDNTENFDARHLDDIWDSHSLKTVKPLWLELKPILRQLKKQNEVNGIMITQSRNTLSNAIAILTGRNQASEYDKKGTTDNNNHGRSLAKA